MVRPVQGEPCIQVQIVTWNQVWAGGRGGGSQQTGSGVHWGCTVWRKSSTGVDFVSRFPRGRSVCSPCPTGGRLRATGSSTGRFLPDQKYLELKAVGLCAVADNARGPEPGREQHAPGPPWAGSVPREAFPPSLLPVSHVHTIPGSLRTWPQQCGHCLLAWCPLDIHQCRWRACAVSGKVSHPSCSEQPEGAAFCTHVFWSG